MPRFDYVVTVETETREQADQVMDEMVCGEDDYGFDYTIWNWEITGDPGGYGD